MAVSVTLLASGTSTTDGASFTTAAVSPAPNSLLVVVVVNAVTGGADATVAGLSAAWTRRVNQAASSSTKLSLHTAQMPASPGSGALTITTSPATGSIVWHVLQVTGHDTTTPIVQAPGATGASSTAAALSYAAAGNPANRLIYACAAAGSATQTPRTSWVELADLTVATPSCSLQTQWFPDGTETTGSSTLSAALLWATAGVEVAAAATTTPVSASTATRWDTAAVITRASPSTTWSVAAPVTAGAATRWDTAATVNDSTPTGWSTAGITTAGRATSWSVAAQTAVPVATGWAVAASVAATAPTGWHTFTTVTSGASTTWQAASSAATTAGTRWDTAATVAADWASRWAVTAAALPPAGRGALRPPPAGGSLRTPATANRLSVPTRSEVTLR